MAGSEPLIPKHGGYRKLKSFQVAQLVYDVTVRFCDRYIDQRSRTHDQMVQAARSRCAEYRGGQPGVGDFEEDRAQADQRGAGEPGRTAAGLPGFPAAARVGRMAGAAPGADAVQGEAVRDAGGGAGVGGTGAPMGTDEWGFARTGRDKHGRARTDGDKAVREGR